MEPAVALACVPGVMALRASISTRYLLALLLGGSTSVCAQPTYGVSGRCMAFDWR